MIELDPQDELNRKVSYIEGELARGDRHKDDVKLLRETLASLTKTAKRFFGRTPREARTYPAPMPTATTVTPIRRNRADEIAEKMAEAGRAAVDEHKNGGDAA